MKVVLFIIFWLAGIVLALLGNRKIREYKDYESPKLFLALGIFLSVFMSWALVILMVLDDTFKFPDWLYHNCYDNSSISFEEEYIDEDGNKVGPKDKWKVHHTYRVYTCRKCGKTWKEQLQ